MKKIMLLLGLVIGFFISCSSDDENEGNPANSQNQIIHNTIRESKLKGTTWQQSEMYWIGGHYTTRKYFDTDSRPLTFTNEEFSKYSNYGKCYLLKVDNKIAGFWYIADDDKLYIYHHNTEYDAFNNGKIMGNFGTGGAIIDILSTTALQYHTSTDETNHYFRYKKISNSGGNSAGSSNYEKPDIIYNSCTPYQTKLKVVYQIYNKEKTNVTSAKVYYGTTSKPTQSVSASVTSAQIIANISGLKKGTTYYVKCTATGKGGTTTTEVTKLMTQY